MPMKKRRQTGATLAFPDRTPATIVPIRDGMVAIPRGALVQLALVFHDIKKSAQQREVGYAKAA